ncbi:MAG: hypothetical protein AAFX55_10145 [Bacteroidota bacterium]
MKRTNFLLFIVLLINIGCKNASKEIFIFKNKNKKIELHIPEGHVILDGETQAKIKLTNIEANNLVVVGVGTSIKNAKKDEMNIIIRTRSSYYQNKTKYELRVSYRAENEKVSHTFYVPFKKVIEK